MPPVNNYYLNDAVKIKKKTRSNTKIKRKLAHQIYKLFFYLLAKHYFKTSFNKVEYDFL